jgi:hypothetical protein
MGFGGALLYLRWLLQVFPHKRTSIDTQPTEISSISEHFASFKKKKMSSAAQVPAKKQQGQHNPPSDTPHDAASYSRCLDLQVTYSNYKNTLQQIAQRIGDIEQEAEEHK